MNNLDEEKKPFSNFEDGENIEAGRAFFTCCDICGEWLTYEAEVEYDPNKEIQEITIKATSCGETFYLIPTGYTMIKDEQSLYTPKK